MAWRPEPCFDFLSDDGAGLFPDFGLDPQTLSAVCSGDPGLLPPPASDATRKRIAADTDDSDDEGKADGQAGRETKRSKADSKDAARTKACREKARREKINERFAELATLIDPSSEPKSDKPSILADAIKHVTQLRVENNQLKQLNKFLEERVAQVHRETGQQAYQHLLMMQHGTLMPGLMPHGLHMSGAQLSSLPSTSLAGPSMPGPSGAHASSSQHLLPMHASATAHPMQAAQAAAQAAAVAAHHAAVTAAAPGSSMHHITSQRPMPGAVPDAYTAIAAAAASMQPQALMQHPGTSSTPTPQHVPLSSTPAGYDAASAAAMGPGGGKGLFLGMGQVGGVVAPPQQHWVPPTMLDSNQDSLLRPPAA